MALECAGGLKERQRDQEQDSLLCVELQMKQRRVSIQVTKRQQAWSRDFISKAQARGANTTTKIWLAIRKPKHNWAFQKLACFCGVQAMVGFKLPPLLLPKSSHPTWVVAILLMGGASCGAAQTSPETDSPLAGGPT